jgi:hypothetical protein
VCESDVGGGRPTGRAGAGGGVGVCVCVWLCVCGITASPTVNID